MFPKKERVAHVETGTGGGYMFDKTLVALDFTGFRPTLLFTEISSLALLVAGISSPAIESFRARRLFSEFAGGITEAEASSVGVGGTEGMVGVRL